MNTTNGFFKKTILMNSNFFRLVKRYFLFFLFTLIFVILIVWFFKCSPEPTLFLGIIGSAISLFFGALKYTIENDRLFYDLFRSFTERYDLRLNDLINNIKNDENKVLDSDEQNLIIDYLNLCSEEYLWYTKRRLSKHVWKSWESGIISNLDLKQIREIFDEEMKDPHVRASYYGLFDELTSKLKPL